jgi:putative Mg2+ transporter-C (MgtC) family protein
MSPGQELELTVRLIAAVLLGGAIGVEREYHGHPAGIRTMAMVSFGSCLFTMLGVFFNAKNQDPTRVAAQVVTGIGFLGAAAILRSGIGVRGLTTAATIWVVAAIGMSVGFGIYILPAIGTLIVIFALVVIKRLEDRLFRKGRRPSPAEEEG